MSRVSPPAAVAAPAPLYPPESLTLKRAIVAQAHALGFDLVRVTTADPFPATAAVLEERIAAGLFSGLPWFSHERAAVAGDPAQPAARRAVIVAARHQLPDRRRADQPPGAPAGRDRPLCLGPGLPRGVQGPVAGARTPLSRRSWAARWAPRALADTARITDRAVAQRAGLGWYGKNTNLLTHEYGSWVLLGELLLDVALPPDAPLRTHCGACTRCLPACPTGAFIAPGVLDNDRCISYLTIELRGPIPRELRPLVGNWIFGCDLCQEVCPVNRHRDPANHPEFRPRPTSAPARS